MLSVQDRRNVVRGLFLQGSRAGMVRHQAPALRCFKVDIGSDHPGMRRSVVRHDLDSLQNTVNACTQSFNTSNMFDVRAYCAMCKKRSEGTAYCLYAHLPAAARVYANNVFFIRPAGHELVNVTELQCIVKSCFCVVGMAVVCEIWFGRSHGKKAYPFLKSLIRQP